MLPINIIAGSEHYILVRRGTEAGRGEPVDPPRARALLESALRRREPQLIGQLVRALRIHDDDPEDIATRLLAELGSTGSLGTDLVLLKVPRGELRAIRESELVPEVEPELEPIEPEPPEEDEAVPEARTRIRVSVFFDGTANNRVNTRAANRGKDEEDRDEDETNVSRLEMMCRHDPSFEHSFSIYVEGIGTRDGYWNSTYGMATGTGLWGVKAKVKRGAKLLRERIAALELDSGEIIELLQVDSFGFSRGAAAARHFIHQILEQDPIEPKIEALGHPVEKLEINFVGIYDTVASIGVNHDNDSDQLRMDAITNAQMVVHLAAAEEHREKFRLTNIASTGGAGIEVFLPGVHSDVGGGYAPQAHEKKLQILDFDQFSNAELERRFERERDWLVNKKGWYEADEIMKVNFWNELRVNRGPIDGRYNRIPLKLMADLAAETGLTWGPIEVRFAIPSDLNWIRDAITAHVEAHRGGQLSSSADYWIAREDEAYKRLRHDYLHFSAHYSSIGMAPQWDTGEPMKGKRQRIVQSDIPSNQASK